MPVEELGDPDSKLIAVPEEMIASCIRHGIVATVTMGSGSDPDEGPHWRVHCGHCGAPCTLERAPNRD